MGFNSLHTVFETAVNAILATGLCAEVNLVMSPNYSIEDGIIKGADYRVECAKEVAGPKNDGMLLTFKPPTKREDGTEITIDEIYGYELTFIDGCASGRTIDTNGVKSEVVVSCVEAE